MASPPNSMPPVSPETLRALADLAASRKHLKKAEDRAEAAEELLFVDVTALGTRLPHFRTITYPADANLEVAVWAALESLGLIGEGPFHLVADGVRYDDGDTFEELSGNGALREAAVEGVPHRNSSLCSLREALPDVGSTAQLVYGKGGGWRIELAASERIAAEEFTAPLPAICVDGEGNDLFFEAASAEEYIALCDVLEDPSHEGYEATRRKLDIPSWADYDEEAFDLLEANYRLAELQIDLDEDELVPTDPDELRDGYKQLLAELLSRECADIVSMAHMSQELQDFQEFVESMGAEGWGGLFDRGGEGR